MLVVESARCSPLLGMSLSERVGLGGTELGRASILLAWHCRARQEPVQTPREML